MASNKPVFEDTQLDAEKGVTSTGRNGTPPAYASSDDQFVAEDSEYSKLGFWTRMGCTPESFKQRTSADKHNQLNQTLQGRHLHMIAIGGSIGAGLFVGSGNALRTGGPASLLITFAIIGVMIFNVVYALGEMAFLLPVSGGFYTYSYRFIDPSWGFAMGWNYVLQWAVVLPLEISIAAITVEFWDTGVNVGVWMTVFLLAILIINIFGVLGYGEEEFWASFLKLSAIVIFMIIALILVLGGGPEPPYDTYWGARTWYDPGAFNNGFKGFCSTFVTAAFSFAGTELVGLAAAESKNPMKDLPSAVKQVFWRITLFYILALLFVGLLVPSDDPDLFGGESYADTSPFVIASRNAGLVGFDSFMNVVILVSVLSIGNSGVYGGSRTLCALAEQGYAPKILGYVDRAGRPLVATVVVLAFSGLSYIDLSSQGSVVFDWLLALSGLSTLFTWGSISLSHIRFRKAWAYHGHTLHEIPFKAVGGVWGSWLALAIIFIALAAQFYTACAPIEPEGEGPLSPAQRVEAFFQSYLSAFVVLIFWGIGFLWKREGWLRIDQMDVDSGRRPIDLEAWYQEVERKKHAPWYKRIKYFFM